MKNNIGFIIIILFLTIPFLSWSSANFEITPDIDTLVPENALAYFHISNPENLMAGIDSFLIATKMNEFIGNMELQDFISMLLISENENLSLDYLNLTNPIGFAILPSTDKNAEKKDMDFMLFLPINMDMNVWDLLKNIPDDENSWNTIFMNYLVYFSSENLKKNFPPKNISNLSHLDSFSNDSLSIYLDINNLIQSFDINTSELIKELEYQNSSNSDFLTRTIEGYFYLFSQLDVLFSNITLNKKGITSNNDLFFSDNIKTIINSFQDVSDIKEWSRHLPEEGFFQSIYLLDSIDQKIILKKILEYLFPTSENDPFMSEFKRTIGMFSDYTGDGGAFSIDFIPSYAQKTEMKKDDSSKNGKGISSIPFGITMSMVTDLTDQKGYIDEFRKYYSDQSINNFMDKLYSDLDFSLHVLMEEVNNNEISPVFKIKYQIQERQTKSGNSLNEMEQVKEFLNSMEFWYHISDNKVYSYIGPYGIEGLKKMIITGSPEKDWVSSAPDNTNLIWNISLTRIIKSLGGIQGLEDLLPLNNISLGISGFSGFQNGGIHSSTNISAEDIMSIIKMIMEKGL